MITINQLTTVDPLDELFDLSLQFFEEYQIHHPYFFNIDHLTEDHVHSYFSRFLNDQDSTVFVAKDHSLKKPTIIGYITVSIKHQADYWTIKRVGEISGLMVAGAYRRKGIATKLFNRAKDFLIGKDVHCLTAFTAMTNRGALKFYATNQMKPLSTTVLGDLNLEH